MFVLGKRKHWFRKKEIRHKKGGITKHQVQKNHANQIKIRFQQNQTIKKWFWANKKSFLISIYNYCNIELRNQSFEYQTWLK